MELTCTSSLLHLIENTSKIHVYDSDKCIFDVFIINNSIANFQLIRSKVAEFSSLSQDRPIIYGGQSRHVHRNVFAHALDHNKHIGRGL